jgi:hypothetical protein
MAHVFDSGLAGAQGTLIREALADALAELRKQPPASKYVVSIVQLPAPLIGPEAEELLRRMVHGYPAVAIALGDRSYQASGPGVTEWQGTQRVHVYLASAHTRGLVDGRTMIDAVAQARDDADPGLDVLAEHVFERLAGLSLAAARGGHLVPISAETAFVDADRTVLELTFDVDLAATVNPDRAVTEVLTDMHTTHTETEAGEPADLEATSELEEP